MGRRRVIRRRSGKRRGVSLPSLSRSLGDGSRASRAAMLKMWNSLSSEERDRRRKLLVSRYYGGDFEAFQRDVEKRPFRVLSALLALGAEAGKPIKPEKPAKPREAKRGKAEKPKPEAKPEKTEKRQALRERELKKAVEKWSREVEAVKSKFYEPAVEVGTDLEGEFKTWEEQPTLSEVEKFRSEIAGLASRIDEAEEALRKLDERGRELYRAALDIGSDELARRLHAEVAGNISSYLQNLDFFKQRINYMSGRLKTLEAELKLKEPEKVAEPPRWDDEKGWRLEDVVKHVEAGKDPYNFVTHVKILHPAEVRLPEELFEKLKPYYGKIYPVDKLPEGFLLERGLGDVWLKYKHDGEEYVFARQPLIKADGKYYLPWFFPRTMETVEEGIPPIPSEDVVEETIKELTKETRSKTVSISDLRERLAEKGYEEDVIANMLEYMAKKGKVKYDKTAREVALTREETPAREGAKPVTEEAVLSIFKEHIKGPLQGMTLRTVADFLEKQGYDTRNVYSVLSRLIDKGEIVRVGKLGLGYVYSLADKTPTLEKSEMAPEFYEKFHVFKVDSRVADQVLSELKQITPPDKRFKELFDLEVYEDKKPRVTEIYVNPRQPIVSGMDPKVRNYIENQARLMGRKVFEIMKKYGARVEDENNKFVPVEEYEERRLKKSGGGEWEAGEESIPSSLA
ncbi:hypothetical protein DRO58_02210, partial [Candidatus Bathyarchaeota archaeon]